MPSYCQGYRLPMERSAGVLRTRPRVLEGNMLTTDPSIVQMMRTFQIKRATPSYRWRTALSGCAKL